MFSKADLILVQDDYQVCTHLIQLICKESEFKLVKSKNPGVFQPADASGVHPDHRQSGQLTFSPAKRVTITERSWCMQKDSIIPLVKGLAAKAGPLEHYNSKGYLSREIKPTGLALATFLDEFHCNPIVLSAIVDRLVRRLIVIETTLGMD